MACPICEKAPSAEYRPFCSRRCADLDLGRWMTGAYRVPSAEPPDEEEIEKALWEDTDRKTH